MTSNTAQCNVSHLLNTLGQLYLDGVVMDVNALYPPVTYPVGRETHSLADIVTWDHSIEHYQELSRAFAHLNHNETSEKTVHVNLSDQEFLSHHRIGEDVVLPLAYLLELLWTMRQETGGSSNNQLIWLMEDVIIDGNVLLEPSGTDISSSFTPASPRFELAIGDSPTLIMTGKLLTLDDMRAEITSSGEELSDFSEVSGTVVYRQLTRLGCTVGPQWWAIERLMVGKTGCIAEIKWTGNLMMFLENIYKLIIYLKTEESEVMMRISSFKRLVVDVKALTHLASGSNITVYYDFQCGRLACDGVVLVGVTLSPVPLATPSLQWIDHRLIPYGGNTNTMADFLSTCVQIVADFDLASWRREAPQLDVVVVKNDNLKVSSVTNLLLQATEQTRNIVETTSELSVEKVAELLKIEGHKTRLVVAELENIDYLVKVNEETNTFYLTYFKGDDISTLETVLVHQSPTIKIALLKSPCRSSLKTEYRVGREGRDWLMGLRRLMTSQSNGQVLVVSRLPASDVLPVVAKETYVSRLRLIFDMDESETTPQSKSLYVKQLSLGLPINILHNKRWCFLSKFDLKIVPVNRNAVLLNSVVMDLNVACVGLNTTILYPDDSTEVKLKHVDYSGHQDGLRVMGVGQLDPFTNTLTPDPTLRWTVPADWTMEEAATVPVVYTLAFYCLALKAKTKPGERVLIHSSSSPIGIALVRVALNLGADVIACVQSEKQEKILRENFTNLKTMEVIVLDRENLAVTVMRITNGKGVKVIVNSQKGEVFQASIKVMGMECRVIHLREIKIEEKESIGMLAFLKRSSFHGLTLDSISRCSEEWKQALQEYVKSGIEQNVVKPTKRRTFFLKEKEEALRSFRSWNFEMKTVLSYKRTNQHLENVHRASRDQLTIIIGVQCELMVAVVEWLAQQGINKMVVLAEDDCKDYSHLERINKVVHSYQRVISFTQISRVESTEGATSLLSELNRRGKVQSIICLQMSDKKKRLTYLELASREVLPELDQWVSLLGDDSMVCQSRATAGLPVCRVSCEEGLKCPTVILPYLTRVLHLAKGDVKFFTVSDNLHGGANNKTETLEQEFPKFSLQQLYSQGVEIEEAPHFVEHPTLSPGYKYTRYSLLPLFVLPGIQPSVMNNFLASLLHPAFIYSGPATMTASVHQQAVDICQEILKIQSKGMFNLLGNIWSSAVTLEVGCLLEARGHQVQLFLLEGGPSVAQDRLTDLSKKHNSDLATGLLADLFNLSPEVTKKLSDVVEWKEKLVCGLSERQIPTSLREGVTKAVTSICSQLTALQLFQAPSHLFQGKVTVISYKKLTQAESKDLSKMCQQPLNTMVTNDSTCLDFLSNIRNTSFINDNIYFDWSL